MTPSSAGTRALFLFTGNDAHKLLNDTLSAAVPENEETANAWALLSPQGKIQAEGLMGRHGDGFWLDTDPSVAASFFKRMSMYKLRADVRLQDVSDTHEVCWADERPSDDGVIAHRDGRNGALGMRLVAPKGVLATPDRENARHDALLVQLGIARLGPDYGADKLFPHDVALDLLGGVDFAKGCYVGQEVVSRMKHRGEARKRPLIAHLAADGPCPEPGRSIEMDGKTVGFIGTPVGGRAVAICRLDRMGANREARIEGQPVTLAVPPWAGYDFS